MQKKTLLLVEDEVIQAMMGKSTLEKYGYAVLTAISGEKAVAAVEAIPEIDLILMDIDLGSGIDGTQAAEQILTRHDIPIVFLSSHMEQEVVAKTEKITSYGYVVKNSPITVLDASIKMAFKLFDAKMNERHKEQTLQQASRKYEILFNSMTEGFALHEIITDESGKPVDYRFLDLNPAFERLTGLKATEIIGKTVMTVMPETEPLWIERYGQVALTGEVLEFDNYSGVLERYYHIVSFSPEKNKFAVIFTDITERKLVELRLQTKNEEYEALNEELQVQNEELRLSDQNLRESEERFKALHNASFGGIAIHERGIILECNQGLSEMSGFSLDELIGMDGLLLIAPEARELVRNNIAAGYEKAYEAVGIRKNGESYDLRLEARNVPYKGRKVRTVEFRDISEQKKTEAALRESEEHYKTLFQKNHAVMLLLDPATGSIEDANQAACEYYGYAHEVITAMPISAINTMPPQQIADEMSRAVRSDKNSYIFRHKLANGEVRDVEVYSGPITIKSKEFLYSMVFDITDRIEADKALRAKTRYLETILQTTPDGFWITGMDRKLVEVNEAYCRMSGYSRDELLALQINDLEASEDPEETKRHARLIAQKGYDIFKTRHRRKDGTVFDIEMSISYIDIDGGRFVCFCRDVSNRCT